MAMLPSHPLPAAFLDRALDEVDDLRLQPDVVEGVDLLHASRAGYVHLGEVVTDDVETDEVEPVLAQARRQLAADLAVTRRNLSPHAGAADVNIAAVLVRARHPQ